MGQFKKSTRRADSFEDHIHQLPDGSHTGGSLHKPSKDQFDMHSHLYECNEDTMETEPMHNFGDHTHFTRLGKSSGPKKPQKAPGDPWQKMDSLHREGTHFVIRSDSGHIIARGNTAIECAKHYDADEEYDESFAKKAMGDAVDEGKWNKAKEMSQAAFGHIKWPFVQYEYQKLGGS